MEERIYDFLSIRKEELFRETYYSLKHLIPEFVETHVVPMLRDYMKHIKENATRISAEEFIDNNIYHQEAFIDFKCYWKMVKLLEDWGDSLDEPD